MTDDESRAYPSHVWPLIESHRELTDALPEAATDGQRDDLQAMIANLELLSLALALQIPAAVTGHTARGDPIEKRRPQRVNEGRLAALKLFLFGGGPDG